MIDWKLQKIEIKRLKPHAYNPRKLTKEEHAQLKKSLERFGLIDKPIVTPMEGREDYQIIGGHQRLKIIQEMGYKEVDCHVSDRPLTPREIDELLIRLNKNNGEWDWDELSNSFEVEDLFDWGFRAEDLHLSAEEKPEKTKAEKTCPNCGEKI
jgi:hypothetical protein